MEKEFLSLLETVKTYHGILPGFLYSFHTDHKNLTFDTFNSECVKHWQLVLKDYDYAFTYTPGKDNIIADMLSHYPKQPVASNIIEETVLSIEDKIDFPMDFATISIVVLSRVKLMAIKTNWEFIIVVELTNNTTYLIVSN